MVNTEDRLERLERNLERMAESQTRAWEAITQRNGNNAHLVDALATALNNQASFQASLLALQGDIRDLKDEIARLKERTK